MTKEDEVDKGKEEEKDLILIIYKYFIGIIKKSILKKGLKY
jgi:hypothetical protein